MKLKSVRVQNYRSVEDSGEFTIGDITCLVGMNESGKTAVLNAIRGINPLDEGVGYDTDKDYPKRHYGEYDKRHADSPAVVCTSKWELSWDDANVLAEEFGTDFLNLTSVTIANNYAGEPTWDFSENEKNIFNEKNIVEHICQQIGFSPAEVRVFADSGSIRTIYEDLDSANVPELNDPSGHLAILKARLGGYREQDAVLAVIDMLSACLPLFVYFSHYSLMSGSLSVEQCMQDVQNGQIKENDRTFNDFLNFAGIRLEDIKGIGKHDVFTTKLRSASNKINDQVFAHWTQNTNLQVNVEIDSGRDKDPEPFNSGTVVHASIHDKKQRIDVPFSERSSGFIWFFSFLARFSQAEKTYAKDGRDLVILLDEPGLSLHAKAQRDLLCYMEKELKSKFQVIYTTHSPFMIFPRRWDTIRTVEDVTASNLNAHSEVQGTKVSDDCLRKNPTTVFPLQSALGYDLSQTLFIGKKVLLVEGVSDVMYLKVASAILHERQKAHLEEWVICPVGGIDKVSAFVSLFLMDGEKRRIVALLDYQEDHDGKIKSLRSSPTKISVLLYTTFCEKQEADIEDIFGKSMYLEILKRSCDHNIDPTSIDDEKRIVKEVKSKINHFSHKQPANWLMHHRELLVSGSDGAHADVDEVLGRFEKIFKKLNSNPNPQKKKTRKKNENH